TLTALGAAYRLATVEVHARRRRHPVGHVSKNMCDDARRRPRRRLYRPGGPCAAVRATARSLAVALQLHRPVRENSIATRASTSVRAAAETLPPPVPRGYSCSPPECHNRSEIASP